MRPVGYYNFATQLCSLARRFKNCESRSVATSIGLIFIVLLSKPIFAQSLQSDTQTQLGVAHIGGLYSFSKTDYLNEGAAQAAAIGAKCIKVSLSLDTDNPSPKYYHFNSQWPSTTTLHELADTPYFQSLFQSGFDTYILTAFRPGRSASYWREVFSLEDERAEEECLSELTRYLLQTYSTTTKTFIIQNWEGDWALRGNFDPATVPSSTATASMIRWLSARQRGVARAREAHSSGGARVFHACEVNLVRQAMIQGGPSATTDVLPHVEVDLASYSAWDTKDSPTHFAEALAFISKNKVQTAPFGVNGVYVGEFGMPESECTPEQAFASTQAMLRKAQSFGCPFAVYWQLYCNEPISQPANGNQGFKGFWLIRPDGSHSLICELFK